LLEAYPDAVVHTLFCDRAKLPAAWQSRHVVTSWLDRVPGVYQHYRQMLPLFPAAVASLDLRGFDLVFSSSHAVAKSADARGALHLCYCHTPMRYLWDAGSYLLRPWQRLALTAVRGPMQRWDRQTAVRVDGFLANSRFVQDRIREFWGRESTVLYPPVDTEFFTPDAGGSREDFYLTGGALVSYKRFDLVIDAFRALHRKLVVVGGGPELGALRRRAGKDVTFAGAVDDLELRRLFGAARAYVFAGREDFGILPVEALCCGCPVIALGQGGVAETVTDGVNGILLERADAASIGEAVRRFEALDWPAPRVLSGTERFGRRRFHAQLKQYVEAQTRHPGQG
jgi:glycosyltransferase involved in cell wall biosynthesis